MRRYSFSGFILNSQPINTIQFERISEETLDSERSSKPLLLFLPGLGGKGFYSSNVCTFLFLYAILVKPKK